MANKKTNTGIASSNWLDKHDMLERFHISSRTLHNWRKLGLRFSKIEGKLYFKDNDVDLFLHKHVLQACPS